MTDPKPRPDRFVCTRERPWREGDGRALHPDAYQVGDQEDGWPCGDIVTRRCRWCGITWDEELPQ